MRWLAVALLAALDCAAPARGQVEPGAAKAFDPQAELHSFTVADGCEVNLFAAEPLAAGVFAINFDPDGRLWASTRKRPDQQTDEKILLFEDDNGDGRADSCITFAGGRQRLMGLEPGGAGGNGERGVYAALGTELVLLKDTAGDRKADFSRVMLAGFGQSGPLLAPESVLRWGPDGALYFNQQDSRASHIETPYGVRRLAGAGIWRFRPNTMELDVFARGRQIQSGVAWDRWGNAFAAGGELAQAILYLFPGITMGEGDRAAKLSGVSRQPTSLFRGLEIVEGRHLPDDWQGSFLTCDVGLGRVCQFVAADNGAGFSCRAVRDVLSSTDQGFLPVDVKQGPDGAIYVVDWYTPVGAGARTPPSDDGCGRIWRITAKQRPLAEWHKLSEASTAALLNQLQSPEGTARRFAKRLLAERGADEVVRELDAWVIDLPQSHADYEHFLLEALWTYQALDVVEPKLLEHLLHAKDAGARAAAVRVLGQWHARLSNPLELLATLIADENPRVRLEAVRALSAVGTTEAGQLAKRVTEKPMDPFLQQALELTERELKPGGK